MVKLVVVLVMIASTGGLGDCNDSGDGDRKTVVVASVSGGQ